MAEEKFKARSFLVYAYIGSAWVPIACLTNNSLQSQLDEINADSKCGDDKQPGDSFEQSIDVEGFSLTVAAVPTKASASKIYDLHAAKTVFNCKIERVAPAVGDYAYEGDVWVSSFNEDAADKDNVKFTATFTVQNPPLTKTIEVA